MEDYITSLEKNQIFVFGSNLAGIHGAGGARQALRWGAKLGQGTGRQGRTYAIPTKDEKIETMPLEEIKPHVEEFLKYAEANPQLDFLVTSIGCGLAGYMPENIAPFFKGCSKNVKLPKPFLL